MRTLLLVLFVLMVSNTVQGQHNVKSMLPQTIADKYRHSIDTALNAYNNKKVVIQPKALNKSLREIYQSIIPNNQSLNDNTSSFSYAQSNENQKISIATAYQFGSLSSHFLNIGISAEGKSGIFNLYSSNSWSNNTSLSLGYSKVVFASQFYNNSSENRKKLMDKRERFADSLSARIQVTSLLKQQSVTDSLNHYKIKMKLFAKLSNATVINEELLDSISLYDKKIKEYTKKIEEYNCLEKQAIDDEVNNVIVNKFVDFDLKNDVMYGYNIIWFQINNKLMNNTYSFKEENNKENTANTNVFHCSINTSIMWNRLGKETMQYATFGMSAYRGSYLSDPSFKGISPVFNGNNIINDGQVLGSLDDLSKPLWQHSFNFYYANFFLFDKHLGFSFNSQYNNAFKSYIGKNYEENYTVSLGPIFKVQGEENWAKATFGISVGYENLPSKANSKDYFILKAYVGVPFNIFQKKNKK